MTATVSRTDHVADVTGREQLANSARSSPDQLPAHVQSLLRIKVPLSVQLASRKEPLGELIKIVPGAILNFDQPCDEMLGLYVSDQRIAAGEVVKVDDKYGLRIVQFAEPDERFHTDSKPEPTG